MSLSAPDRAPESYRTASPAPDIEALFAEARARARRRRILIGAAMLTAVAAIVGAVLILVSAVAGSATASSSTWGPLVQADPPPRYVVHGRTWTARPGEITVMDTATGAAIRNLGTTYDPYPQNGFQLSPDGRTLYYVRLPEGATEAQIVAAPTDGTPERVVDSPGFPIWSPDGRKILGGEGNELLIKDTGGQITRRVNMDDAGIPTLAASLTWLPDSRHILLAGEARLEFSGFGSPLMNDVPRTVITTDYNAPGAAILDAQTGEWSHAELPLVNGQRVGYRTLLGPGPLPGTVLAMPFGPESPIDGAPLPLPDGAASGVLLTVDPRTGKVLHSNDVPAGCRILDVDTSGTNLLLSDFSGDRLDRWELVTGEIVPLGPRVDEATW